MQATQHRPARRFDIYRPIHKALRACMGDTLLRVGNADPADGADVAAVLVQVRELAEFCALHLKKENTIVHPAMEARRVGSTSLIAGDHEHHGWAIDKIETLCRDVEAAPADDAAARDAALHGLYRYLAVFVGENLSHMNVEETDHNAVLWATHTDEEIMAIEHAIVAGLGPEEKAKSLRWMLPALNHAERVGFLSGMRAAVPPFVFDGVLAIARQHLAARDFAKLSAALGLEEKLAA